MVKKKSMPPKLLALMERFAQLGRLLPQGDELDLDLDDPVARAEAEVVLQEMALVKAQIGELICR